MSIPEPNANSFQTTFCMQYGVPAERYGETVLRLTFYPHARWLLAVATRRFLAADHKFVADVGRVTRWRDFAHEARDFQENPQNALFWRRTLRLRVSVARMRVLFSEVMGGTPLTPPSEPSAERRPNSEPGSFVLD